MKALIFATLLMPQLVFAALVDPALQAFYNRNSGTVKVLVLMEYPRTPVSAPIGNASDIHNYLIRMARQSWTAVWPQLQNDMDLGHIKALTVYPINNSFSVVVDAQGLYAIANATGVSKLYMDRPIGFNRPVSYRDVGRFEDVTGGDGVPYDIQAMGLDKLWATRPELIGTGVLVGHIDTGIDGRHPALAGKIVKFFNASNGQFGQPFDDGNHGTHTAGTIAGNARNGAPMGVAPGARLIGAAGLTGYGEMLKAMEMMMDPDGNPATDDKPKLVSNSWNCEGAPDLEAFYRAISAWDAAGILPVFSAGNSGPRAQSITKPHEHPLVMAVGAHGADGRIADFSSRGPGIFNGQKTQKPDLAAPGVNIVSSVPGGGFASMSGTSMAAPHIAGLAAIMYQLNPKMTPAQAREILIKTVDNVDENGQAQTSAVWNASFGFGRANALKAIATLQNMMGFQARRFSTLFTGDFMGLGRKEAVVLKKSSLDTMKTFVTDRSAWVDGKALVKKARH